MAKSNVKIKSLDNIVTPLISKTSLLHVLNSVFQWGSTLRKASDKPSYTADYKQAMGIGCLTTGRSGFDPKQGQRIFPLASVSRPALGPTQPPVPSVPGVLSPGVKRGRGVMLTTHPQLVPRSRMSRSYTFSPPKRLHGV
jgi:hypothetical protein